MIVIDQLPTLNLVVIRSADMDRSAEFYSKLGLIFTKHSHGKGPEHYACELGSVVFDIYPAKEKENTAGTRLGFQLNEIDSTIRNLIEHGAAIISEPKDSEWGRRAVVADPDGHKVELVEY